MFSDQLSANILENNKLYYLNNRSSSWNYFGELLDDKLDLCIPVQMVTEFHETVQDLYRKINNGAVKLHQTKQASLMREPRKTMQNRIT